MHDNNAYLRKPKKRKEKKTSRVRMTKSDEEGGGFAEQLSWKVRIREKLGSWALMYKQMIGI